MKNKILDAINSYRYGRAAGHYNFNSLEDTDSLGNNALMTIISLTVDGLFNSFSEEEIDYLLNNSNLSLTNHHGENIAHLYFDFLYRISGPGKKDFNNKQLFSILTKENLLQVTSTGDSPLVVFLESKMNSAYQPSEDVIDYLLANSDLKMTNNNQKTDQPVTLPLVAFFNGPTKLNEKQIEFLFKNSNLSAIEKNGSSPLLHFLYSQIKKQIPEAMIDYLIDNSPILNDKFYALAIYFRNRQVDILNIKQIKKIISRTDFSLLNTLLKDKEADHLKLNPLLTYFSGNKEYCKETIKIFLNSLNLDFNINPKIFNAYIKSRNNNFSTSDIELFFNKTFIAGEKYNNFTMLFADYLLRYDPSKNLKLYNKHIHFIIENSFKNNNECFNFIKAINMGLGGKESSSNIEAGINKYLKYLDISRIYQGYLDYLRANPEEDGMVLGKKHELGKKLTTIIESAIINQKVSKNNLNKKNKI